MQWNLIIKEIVAGTTKISIKLVLIIIPLILVLEIAKYYRLLDNITRIMAPFLNFFSLPDSTGLPLLVGQIFGLTYGAGVIIQEAKEEEIAKIDVMTMTVFLALCHALIEDTLLFMTLGGKGFVIAGIRIIYTTVVVYIFSKTNK